MLSTEQVTFAAMRHGFDDLMAFLNVTISLVCVLFAWVMVLFAIQGEDSRRFETRTELISLFSSRMGPQSLASASKKLD